jgi:hypothetical protein
MPLVVDVAVVFGLFGHNIFKLEDVPEGGTHKAKALRTLDSNGPWVISFSGEPLSSLVATPWLGAFNRVRDCLKELRARQADARGIESRVTIVQVVLNSPQHILMPHEIGDLTVHFLTKTSDMLLQPG